VKSSKAGNFTLCNPLKIQVGAGHGVPDEDFFTPSCAVGYDLARLTALQTSSFGV
jgi:hypothetical protein